MSYKRLFNKVLTGVLAVMLLSLSGCGKAPKASGGGGNENYPNNGQTPSQQGGQDEADGLTAGIGDWDEDGNENGGTLE